MHVDADTLQEGVAGRCELEEGPALAVETARRLACDASVVSVVENAQGEPLNIGRKSRTIPPAIRRALNARDRGGRFPGCSNTRYVDAHHVQHWARGGETKLSNLALLCSSSQAGARKHGLRTCGRSPAAASASGAERFRRNWTGRSGAAARRHPLSASHGADFPLLEAHTALVHIARTTRQHDVPPSRSPIYGGRTVRRVAESTPRDDAMEEAA